MRKFRVWPAFITVVVAAAAVFGAIRRGSYTDVVRGENFMEQAMIPEFGEKIAAISCEQMEQALPEAPVILRVSPVAERKYFFRGGRQKVVVRQVFKGEETRVGEEFYVSFSRWCVLPGEGNATVQSGFVNILKEGRDYLVFLDDPFVGLDGERAYPFYDENFITPAFCYADGENITIPVEEGLPSFVPYSTVRENEFFASSEEGLRMMLDLKHWLLERYAADL